MMAESAFELPPAPRPAAPRHAVDPVDAAIAAAARIVSNDPRFHLPLPKRIAWFCWAWKVEYGDKVVADGRAWTERRAHKWRWKAYVKADAQQVADRAKARERRDDGPVSE